MVIRPLVPDDRGNLELKAALREGLAAVKNKLKVVSMRQTREPGIVINVASGDDIKLIKETNFGAVKLRAEEPKRIKPAFVIYDIEPDAKAEDIKADLLSKNFETATADELERLEKELCVRHGYTNKRKLKNWILEAPPAAIEHVMKEDECTSSGAPIEFRNR